MMSPVASEQSHSAAAEEAPAHTEPASPESIKLKEETNEDEGRSEKLDTGQQQQSKGEKFDGKIVYNPDGSAYIMEDKDDDDVLPKQEGSVETEPSSEVTNAFFISKSSAYYNALYGQAYVKMLQDKKVPETPVVHSYRVYSPMRESLREDDAAARLKLPPPLAEYATVPVKPVLMCFVCKLSFGCTETFANHCAEGHSIELSSEEKAILESKNSSAIIQNMGSKEKEPAVSFLEPILSPNGSKLSPPFSSGAITSLLAAAAAANQFPKVPITSSSSSSLPLPLRTPSTSSSPRIPTPTSPSAADSRMSPPEAMGFSIIAAAGMRSNTVSPAAGSPSPVQSLPHTPPAYPTMPTNANMLQGTTIGACPDHVNGRPTGVECSKCDLILNQSRLSSMGWNVSRNSCKTLKCPKCNWHYKYQETLEIHMKEKHPDSETTCIYCITGQQHPRLARGETYTCGYKPYRCEVCNYSTTTKGNLSIHMQSDKHLNNMQELQNGGIPTSMADAVVSASSPKLPITSAAGSLTPRSLPPPPSMTSPSPLASPSKQKPSWRCDVCNYETNVARNLRIHMTSEKHTHNMMSLQQQGAKAAAMQQMGSMQLPPGFPGMLPGLDPKQLLQLHHNLATAAGGGLMNPPPTSSPSPSEQAAMADLAYNQAVLAQLMSGGQFPGPPPDFSALLAASAGAAQDPADAEPPPEPTDPNPRHLFTCCVCRQFGCDSVDELSLHLSHDRSRTRENEVSIVIGGNSLCQLCNYKTNLKANFQLHCKTDKHLQRLSHVNHIKEGGACNEWKLRFLASLNPVELRCNACDFYTNSPHKLQVHISNQQHQVSSLLFFHLQKMERRSLRPSGLSYNCVLCQFSAPGKHLLMVHVRSMKHLQMEQVHQLKKRAEGNQAQTEIGEIFQVSEEDEDQNDGKLMFSVLHVLSNYAH
jgi:AT-binding transcription factor 1